MSKVIYICLFAIGLLPGIIIVLISLFSFNKPVKGIHGEIMGENSFPTAIFISKTNLTFSPSWIGIILLSLGIILYIVGLMKVINKNIDYNEIVEVNHSSSITKNNN